ncbi:MAG: hypothetical protein KAI66_05800, partial [Lentisphaeria bacterium]|nr:hypothetical protein [Lentisphaeria bacterium]
MQAWIRRALNDATPTAYRVAVLFDGDGSRWVTEDDRELHDVIVEHGGEKTATNDSRDERWQFADQSAIVVSESAWDVGFGWLDDCCCWRGAQTDNEDWGGHNRDCSWSRPTVDLVVGGPSVTPTLQPIVAPCSGTPTSVAAESDSTETLSGPTPARPRTPCSE